MSKNKPKLQIITEIERAHQQINALRPFDQEKQNALQEQLRIEWTYNSNAIEGNALTLGETNFFLREGLTSEGKPLKDYLEAKNHVEAIDTLYQVVKNKREITESFIKELHALLMKDIKFIMVRGGQGQIVRKEITAGQYKKRPNHVLTISGKIHYYADPIKIIDEMEKLLKWLNRNENLNPVVKAAIFHYRFVRIHPFNDGNGRMARLLMNLILMREKYFPCIIQNAHRREYLESLELADSKKDENYFIAFVAQELLITEKHVWDILKNKKTAQLSQKKILNRLEREKQILSVLKKSDNPISIGQIFEQLPYFKRPTLKSDLQKLVAEKKITAKGEGKGVLYYL